MVSKYKRLTANDFIAQERINQIAISNWIPCTDERFKEITSKEKFKYDRNLVHKLYQQELLYTGFSYRRVMALELNEYLERYLWPNYKADTATREETLSICAMVNEKARERIPIWKSFIGSPEEFRGLINRVLHYLLEENIPLENNLNNETDQRLCVEHVVMLIFLSHCFTNLAEVGVLRSALREVYSLATWRYVNKNRYQDLIKQYPRMGKLLNKMTKYEANKLTEEERQSNDYSHEFLTLFVKKFLTTLDYFIMSTIKPHSLIMQYLSRCLLWFIDLLSMLLTRRFLSVVFDDAGLIVRCEYAVERMHSPELSQNYPMKQLWLELTKMIKLYALFQIDDITGDPLDDSDLDKRQCDAIIELQRSLYILFKDENPKIIDFTTCSISLLEDPEKLNKCLKNLNYNELYRLAERFAIVPPLNNNKEDKREDQEDDEEQEPNAKKPKMDLDEKSREYEFLLRMLIYKFAKRQSHLEDLNEISLYPTEDIIWDESRVPMEFYSGDECLALPKLGLQFLTLHDYLLRNFNLFRLETAFEIRHDLEDSIKRLKPWSGEHGQAVFDGWSRMALPIQSFNMIEVAKPALGSRHPSRVRADVRVTLVGLRSDIRKEWEQLRRYDPIFLVTIRPTLNRGWKFNPDEPFCKQFGVAYVRGCEIEGQVDLEGKLIPDEERFGLIPGRTIDKKTYVQNSPTWRVKLDPCQYQADLNNRLHEEKLVEEAKECLQRAKREGRPKEQIKELEKRLLEVEEQARAAEDIYGTFNLLVRRKPKENNFKAVLETIRDLMNTRSVVPDWLLDLLMGYLDPAEAHYSRQLEKYEREQNWYDTFLSVDHLKSALSQYKINFEGDDSIQPPFKIKFPDLREDYTVKVEAMMDDTLNQKSESNQNDQDKCSKKPLEIIVKSVEKPIEPKYELMPSNKRERHSVKKKLGNLVNFTKAQIEAIRSGMQFGLTLIIGPPGTGKTDVAVQIIQNLYHNYPNQRILIVTHSNQALNQLFEKIIALNVDERHLLRLGHGEEDLATSENFSRYGRVDYILQRRIELLKEVMHLSKTLCTETSEVSASAVHAPFEMNPHLLDKAVAVAHQEVVGKTSDAKETAVAVAEAVLKAKTTAILNAEKDIKTLTKKVNDEIQMYTCETAQYFFVQTILPLWEDFMLSMSLVQKALTLSKKESANESNSAYMTEKKANEKLKIEFPFLSYFTGSKEPNDPVVNKFFDKDTFQSNLDIARACFRHLAGIFSKLDEFRAFELMRNGIERSNYLLTQEAKIIAMTCTHAALRRRDLVQLGFTYDTIIMEEAAQILEIETFIPLLLQNPDISGKNRLRRWIMIGDHNQLPPVVKNQAFNNYSNMGQSLFARLVKLGVPTVQLDSQGRARPSLSKYYSWRYNPLLDLEHTKKNPEYIMANPGFVYDSQLIDVGDYKGIGESEPSPYFYQNLAEAEYIVAVYMYMRILGYPPEKISILTTYNGQKHLIRDVLKKRCSDNPIFGLPSKVTTVDRFQGQQNDYILVSLVRTRTVGHLRDVRRLVVALSRARLGLYIFARVSQFMSCQELRPAFRLLLGFDQPKIFPNGKPTKLQLIPSESYKEVHGMKSGSIPKNVRKITDPIPTEGVTSIRDMVEIANFVTNLYNDQMQSLLEKLPKHVQEAIQLMSNNPPMIEEQKQLQENTSAKNEDEEIEAKVIPESVRDEQGNSSDEGNVDV